MPLYGYWICTVRKSSWNLRVSSDYRDSEIRRDTAASTCRVDRKLPAAGRAVCIKSRRLAFRGVIGQVQAFLVKAPCSLCVPILSCSGGRLYKRVPLGWRETVAPRRRTAGSGHFFSSRPPLSGRPDPVPLSWRDAAPVPVVSPLEQVLWCVAKPPPRQ